MTLKGYTRFPELDPHPQMQFNIICRVPFFACFVWMGDTPLQGIQCNLSPVNKSPILSSPCLLLNSEFSFSLSGCLTKSKEFSLFYFLIAGSWTNGLMPFPKAKEKGFYTLLVLILCIILLYFLYKDLSIIIIIIIFYNFDFSFVFFKQIELKRWKKILAKIN